MNRYRLHESKHRTNYCSRCGAPAVMTLCNTHRTAEIIGEILSKPNEAAFEEFRQAFTQAAQQYLNQPIEPRFEINDEQIHIPRV